MAECDADKDSLLNLAEYKVFRGKMADLMREKMGDTFTVTDEEMAEQYAILNVITPGVEGCSGADMHRFQTASKTISAETGLNGV